MNVVRMRPPIAAMALLNFKPMPETLGAATSAMGTCAKLDRAHAAIAGSHSSGPRAITMFRPSIRIDLASLTSSSYPRRSTMSSKRSIVRIPPTFTTITSPSWRMQNSQPVKTSPLRLLQDVSILRHETLSSLQRPCACRP